MLLEMLLGLLGMLGLRLTLLMMMLGVITIGFRDY
jgi:hypothetical protein